jgi:hypothetical protein
MKSDRFSIKTKLLIYEYKERYPQLSPGEICMIFYLPYDDVDRLFDEEYIIVPSKMNINNRKKREAQKYDFS